MRRWPGRMGMQKVRDELEDISFQVLNPDANKIIKDRLAQLHEESGDVLREIEKALATKLAENGIKAEVYGREKRAYSIWRKMERKHLSLGQLSDIFGFRVIVGTVDQCYRASASCTAPGAPCRVASRTTSRRPSRMITARCTRP